ncbi:MAG: dTMP kinase [Myxococcota bacterium]
MIEGQFIVIEGVDGAGTTTQTRLLVSALRKRGLPVRATCEPSDGPFGMMLRQILTGRVVVPGMSGARPPSWTTMALLFAADRLDHLEAEVVPNLMDGVTVVSDRYDHSSVAYQSVTGETEEGEEVVRWLKEINRHARRPDLTVVLDVPPEVAAKRRSERDRVQELYDDEEVQQRLAAFYVDIDRHFPEDRIVHVDATKDVEAVAADVMRAVRELRGE